MNPTGWRFLGIPASAYFMALMMIGIAGCGQEKEPETEVSEKASPKEKSKVESTAPSEMQKAVPSDKSEQAEAPITDLEGREPYASVPGVASQYETDSVPQAAVSTQGSAQDSGMDSSMSSEMEQAPIAAPSETEEEALPPPPLEPETVNVQFDINSSSLNEVSESILTEAAKTVAEHEEATVTLTGYTDQSGSKEYNEQLAKKRVDAVAAFLMAEGVDNSRIVREVAGEADPALAPAGEDPASWNRRVEVRIE